MDQIKRLWELLPHLPHTTVRWYARTLDGKVKWGGYADTLIELRNAIVHCPDMNFYVCPNPATSKIGVRHSTEDVSHWSWFLIDVDPITKGEFDPRPLIDGALLWLGEWTGQDFARPGSQPIIIDSGRGMQVWIRLEDSRLDSPCSNCGEAGADAKNRRIARLTMRYWLKRLDEKLGERFGCKIDTTSSDLPRPMRCPGTLNQKTKREALFVSDSDRVFRGLHSRLVAGVPPKIFAPDPVPSLVPGAEWQDVYVHLTLKAQDYLLHGKLDPGRHETAWHTARNLAEHGLTRAAVERAIRQANQRQGPDMELSDQDVEHAINTGFKDLTSPPGCDTIS